MAMYNEYFSISGGNAEQLFVPKFQCTQFRQAPMPLMNIQPIYDVKNSGKSLLDLPSMILPIKDQLIGMENVYGTSIENFCCTLCNKGFHMNLTVGHLKGNSHRMEYCHKHYPELHKELKKLQNENLHGFLSQLLEIIAREINIIDPCQLPAFYDPKWPNFNEDFIHNKHSNFHLVSHTQEGFERTLIEIITEKIRESNLRPSKDIKAKVSKLQLPDVSNSEVSSINAASISGNFNFLTLMHSLDILRLVCKLDQFKLDQLTASAHEFESHRKNASNILLENDVVKFYILDERAKIEKTEFDADNMRNEAELAKFMIDTLIPDAKQYQSLQVEVPEAPSGDIFKNGQVEESVSEPEPKAEETKRPEKVQTDARNDEIVNTQGVFVAVRPSAQYPLQMDIPIPKFDANPIIELQNFVIDPNMDQVVLINSDCAIPVKFRTTAFNLVTQTYEGLELQCVGALH